MKHYIEGLKIAPGVTLDKKTDTMLIRWYDAGCRGELTIYLSQFFPCTQGNMKMIISMIEDAEYFPLDALIPLVQYLEERAEELEEKINNAEYISRHDITDLKKLKRNDELVSKYVCKFKY